MRYLTLAALAATFALTACDAAGGPSGPPALGIVSGNDQVAPAGTDSLVAPVRAQLGRTPGGQITFRLVSELHAQTNVRGIANHVVNAVPIGEDGLDPWNPSAMTDADGVAAFWFEPGTRAGERCAEIRAVVDGHPTVTDVACATVEAGAVVVGSDWWANGDHNPVDYADSEARFECNSRAYWDAHENLNCDWTVEADGWLTAAGGEAGTEDGRTVHLTVPADELTHGDTATVRFRAADGGLIVDAVAEFRSNVKWGDEMIPTWSLRAVPRAHWSPSS